MADSLIISPLTNQDICLTIALEEIDKAISECEKAGISTDSQAYRHLVIAEAQMQQAQTLRKQLMWRN